MGLFSFLFGSRSPDAAQPRPPVPLDALEEVKDRIVAACEARSDWNAQTKIRIAAKARETFYMTLAARDLLRASSLDRDDVANIGILLERMAAAESELASSLDALGADARDLRRDLEKAFRPCNDGIRQRLGLQDG
jgi:acyl-homoserine lactone acylase PvdQ